ncbi:MAG: hypothetical protein ACPLF9_05520 [Methanothermobacter tenebrarum]|mgnify:CR=1 FL=1|nr:hypothetical protein [Methanobacteriales archaeon]NPV64079.1 hypothetical protein [Methanobacteriaceae archaeon]HPQ05427.1 hypothetical protein [Methanothermobacter sp.]
MARRKPDINKVRRMLERIERIYTSNKIYTQKVYMDARTACKLEIISYLESRSKSEISRKAIRSFINAYESKNGSLLNKIKKY